MFLSFHTFTLLMGDVFEGTIPVPRPGNIASLWFILIAPEQTTSNQLIMLSVCQHKLLNMKLFQKMRKTVFHSYINNDTGLCISQFQRCPSPPRATTGHLLKCLSRGWGISNFIAARGLGISLPRGDPRAFDTRVFEYGRVCRKGRGLRERLASPSRTRKTSGCF